MLDVWCTSFSRIVKIPVGVGCPGRPVLTLDRAIRIPLRYTYATGSVVLATISKGPSGARSGSQTYSPVFSVTVSGETRTPSVKVSADRVDDSRTSRAAARIRMRHDDNDDFMYYLPISSTALRSGALDALMNPSKGRFISRTRKIAEETDTAQMSSTASTVPLRGANIPKVMKRPVSQKISNTRNGDGRVFCCPSIKSRRVCNTSLLICKACARSEYCRSFFGVSSRSLP